jgi:hypothetical protein
MLPPGQVPESKDLWGNRKINPGRLARLYIIDAEVDIK